MLKTCLRFSSKKVPQNQSKFSKLYLYYINNEPKQKPQL